MATRIRSAITGTQILLALPPSLGSENFLESLDFVFDGTTGIFQPASQPEQTFGCRPYRVEEEGAGTDPIKAEYRQGNGDAAGREMRKLRDMRKAGKNASSKFREGFRVPKRGGAACR